MADDNLACPSCSYPLRGLAPDAACPECGLDLSAALVAIRAPARLAAHFSRFAQSPLIDCVALFLLPRHPVIAVIALETGLVARFSLAVAIRRVARPLTSPTTRDAWSWSVAGPLALLPLLVLLLGGSKWVIATTWLVSTLYTAALTGLLASALGRLLSLETVVSQLRVQRFLIAASLLVATLLFSLLPLASLHAVLILQTLVVSFAAVIALGHTLTAFSELSRTLRALPVNGVDLPRTTPCHASDTTP